jgi:hypothetical protein
MESGERGFVAETEIVEIIKNIKWRKAAACREKQRLHREKMAAPGCLGTRLVCPAPQQVLNTALALVNDPGQRIEQQQGRNFTTL